MTLTASVVTKPSSCKYFKIRRHAEIYDSVGLELNT
jgi:hypothetical protein